MYAVGRSDNSKNMGQVYFHYAGDGSTSNRISMGLHGVDDVFNILGTGNVGIGETSPQSWAKLQVAGTAGAQTGANQALYVTAPSTTAGEGVGIRLSAASGSNEAVGIIGMVNNASGNAGSMTFHTYNGGADVPERMRITSTGTIFMYGLGGYTSSNADVRYATSSSELYYQTSSKRYKTDIVNLENSLDKINSLRPVRYVDINTNEPACGLIAEETVEVIPEVVFTKEIEGFDKPQVEGINYSDIVPFLIKSIQELKAEVEQLKTQINN
jgi:hypothetical protein